MSTIDDADQIERWTASRKLEVVKKSLRGDITEEELCQKYGITRSEFRDWKEEALEGAEEALVQRRTKDPQQKEIERLKQKVGELTIANDVLKKNVQASENKGGGSSIR